MLVCLLQCKLSGLPQIINRTSSDVIRPSAQREWRFVTHYLLACWSKKEKAAERKKELAHARACSRVKESKNKQQKQAQFNGSNPHEVASSLWLDRRPSRVVVVDIFCSPFWGRRCPRGCCSLNGPPPPPPLTRLCVRGRPHYSEGAIMLGEPCLHLLYFYTIFFTWDSFELTKCFLPSMVVAAAISGEEGSMIPSRNPGDLKNH